MDYRDARSGDIQQAVDVFVNGVVDLCRKNNLPAPPPANYQARAREFEHTLRTGTFRVAEENGRLAAICSGQVRDGIFFLAKFWTVADHQGKGVGRPLLEQVWTRARELGAQRFFVWSSIDWPAISLYLRMGMLPGSQLFRFAGESRELPDTGLEPVPLEVDAAAAIDREVRGTAREIDHAFFRDVERRTGWSVGDRAYFYLQDGWIGPAGWLDPELGPAVLATAARLAGGPVRFSTPGTNHAALRFATSQGLRLTGTAHLLMTEPFGQFDRYLPSGPELF